MEARLPAFLPRALRARLITAGKLLHLLAQSHRVYYRAAAALSTPHLTLLPTPAMREGLVGACPTPEVREELWRHVQRRRGEEAEAMEERRRWVLQLL
jgi:hypothetical protein